jgi:hypothetical protein
MVEFNNQAPASLKSVFNQPGASAQVRNKAQPMVVAADHQTHGIRRVMAFSKGLDKKVVDFQGVARAE